VDGVSVKACKSAKFLRRRLILNNLIFMNFLPPTHDLALFATAAIVLLLIPGPAVLYIVARSVDQGRIAGLASAAGIAIGTLVHVLAASLGLSALLLSSATAYSALKYAGAGYLFYLGIKKFRERPRTGNGMEHVKLIPMRKVFAQGIVVNIFNPKIAIFFFAFLPQFVSPARGHVTLQFFTLGMLYAFMGWASDSTWALSAGSAAHWFRSNRKFIENERYAAGTVYMGLGLATALTGSRHK
jgi:threonine/homoserine/homoserine lactone efflux protein